MVVVVEARVDDGPGGLMALSESCEGVKGVMPFVADMAGVLLEVWPTGVEVVVEVVVYGSSRRCHRSSPNRHTPMNLVVRTFSRRPMSCSILCFSSRGEERGEERT